MVQRLLNPMVKDSQICHGLAVELYRPLIDKGNSSRSAGPSPALRIVWDDQMSRNHTRPSPTREICREVSSKRHRLSSVCLKNQRFPWMRLLLCLAYRMEVWY